MNEMLDPDAQAKESYAIEIVQRRFSKGLAELCDPRFLTKRYSEFLRRDDPIYVKLLQGMEDEPLAKTFVSYWTIAQTLATKSRFWLEDAVAEIIYWQAKRFGRDATHVYSQSMLGQGYLQQNRSIANIGEDEIEHLTNRSPWLVIVKTDALREVDISVGEQERQRQDEEQRKPFERKVWSESKNKKSKEEDEKQVKRIADAVKGLDNAEVPVQCNLLVIEPNVLDKKPHAFASRFVNPKTISSHAQRKQERVNILRLYAYLVQEKILRDPTTIHVYVAELLPRYSNTFEAYDHYPDYFSPITFMSSHELWEFIGVPFSVVTKAICNVAKEFRKQLIEGLRDLLPEVKDESKKQHNLL